MNQRTTAAHIRYTLCDVSSQTKTPHLGSCLSCVDILTALYFGVMNIDPSDPKKSKRDYFLLGKAMQQAHFTPPLLTEDTSHLSHFISMVKLEANLKSTQG